MIDWFLKQPFAGFRCQFEKRKSMKRLSTFFIIGFAFVSCNDEGLDQKTLDVKKFTIVVPSQWTLEEVQGFDSFVTRMMINDQDFVTIDLGAYSDNLNVDASTHEVMLSMIDGRAAKIVKPKRVQNGTTGVFFDSIDIDKNKLQLSGVNLSGESQHLLLSAIEGIKFK